MLILPWDDPLTKQSFGAGECELEEAHAYRRAMRELVQRRVGRVPTNLEEELEADGDNDGRPPRRRVRSRRSEGCAARCRRFFDFCL